MSAVLLAASLSTVRFRNDLMEFCTTRTYGFPLPWFADWCLCERDSWPVQPVWCAINVAVCIGLGSLIALGMRMIFHPPQAGSPAGR
jgi:hypothetical protein